MLINQSLEQPGTGQSVWQVGTEVANPEFQGGIAVVHPGIPPNLGAVLEGTGLHQKLNVTLKIGVAGELLGDPGPGQSPEGHHPVALETGVAAFPKRR